MRTALLFISLMLAGSVWADDAALPHWIDIKWMRGPDLPQAFQDSDGGIVNDMLITTCGYSDSGQTIPPAKKQKSPVGHHKKTWGLKLSDAAAVWETLPDFPGDARQELGAIA